MGVLVDNPGILTTIQDKGRYGWEKFGMSPAGPMDERAFSVANLLVGNEAGESGLECTIMGPTLTFQEETVIAVTGADMGPQLNGEDLPMYRAAAVRAGDTLRLGAVKAGCRSYIAFAGGIDVPAVMGSRATALKNRVGGLEGRRLNKGDTLMLGKPALSLSALAGRSAPVPPPQGREVTVRVILGPQDDRFTDEGIKTFLSQPYTVGKDFDRMGCRLEGPVITHKTDCNIISDGMVTGAIQVPGTGQPIIMLAERQTVGGYTKIAVVISADLPVIGQCKAGDVVRFQAVTLAEAHALCRERQQEMLELAARLARPAERHYQVTVNGEVFTIGLSEL